jgi:hypothetical protein
LVIPNSDFSSDDTPEYIDKLNQALEQAPVEVRQRLHLDHFEAIGIEDYQCIVDVRNFAIAAGYPELK